MKKTIFFIPLLMILNASFGQQTNPVLELTKQDYLQKSKKQKKTGSVFFAVGAGLIITSVILPKGELLYDGICIFGFCDDKYQNDGMKAALGLTGVVSLLGSIPFFVASGKNKKRAMSMSFKNETAPQIVKSSFVYKSVPSVSLKISL